MMSKVNNMKIFSPRYYLLFINVVRVVYMAEILLNYTRAGKVESVHYGDFVVVDVNGKIIDSVGEPHKKMFWRSAAKPFQALPFVKEGGVERFNITQEELALMTSSHSGEEFHVKLVNELLEKVDLDVSALDCGPATPMSSKAARALTAQGLKPEAVHNACSGKHSGMLALAQAMMVEVEGYTKPDHKVQQKMIEAVAKSTNLAVNEVEIGIDGCGVPVFYLPLYNMSLAYARLAQPEAGQWGEDEQDIKTIRDAMIAHPLIVSGTGRIDSLVTQITKGRIIAKIGAEAVYCLAVVDKGWGITFKIQDGSFRAINQVVIGILKRLNLLTAEEYAQLVEKFPPILKNHRGDVIGTIEVGF